MTGRARQSDSRRQIVGCRIDLSVEENFIRRAKRMALKIVMFSDFVCPFCYIGFDVIQKLKPEFNLQIEWRGFQIHPEWPADGATAVQMSQLGDPEPRNRGWVRISSMAESV